MSGHSLGAFTTLLLGGMGVDCNVPLTASELNLPNPVIVDINPCAEPKVKALRRPMELADPRIKAMIALAPPFFSLTDRQIAAGASDIGIPTMMITGLGFTIRVHARAAPADRPWHQPQVPRRGQGRLASARVRRLSIQPGAGAEPAEVRQDELQREGARLRGLLRRVLQPLTQRGAAADRGHPAPADVVVRRGAQAQRRVSSAARRSRRLRRQRAHRSRVPPRSVGRSHPPEREGWISIGVAAVEVVDSYSGKVRA
jgi:hypothetical protein